MEGCTAAPPRDYSCPAFYCCRFGSLQAQGVGVLGDAHTRLQIFPERPARPDKFAWRGGLLLTSLGFLWLWGQGGLSLPRFESWGDSPGQNFEAYAGELFGRGTRRRPRPN